MANEKTYYLNNFSDSPITIELTAKRTIPAKASFPMNNKDVQLFKEMKAKRSGRRSMLDDLCLSTIRIEEDTRYAKVASNDEIKAELEAKAAEIAANAGKPVEVKANTGDDKVDAFLNGETNEVPAGTTELSDEEAAKLELEAKAAEEAKKAEEAKAAEAANAGKEAPQQKGKKAEN